MDARRNERPSLLLAGVDGTFNFGGEAILRGTVRLLREQLPACRITVATAQPDEDAARLRDLEGVAVVQARRRWTPARVALGVARRVGIGSGSRRPLRRDLVDGHDVLLSVGGDNYGFMNERGRVNPVTFDLVALAERALARGKKAVLWGASVGPFDADPAVRERFARHLRRLSLITAREAETVEYLTRLGCARAAVGVADPAFLMAGSEVEPVFERSSGAITLGVNFSPAALAHLFEPAGGRFARAREELARCLEALLRDERVRVLLVPHVIEAGCPLNDDHALLAGLLAELGERQGRLRLLPPGLGAVRTKGLIAGCDAVVAARMHCCVAALSSGVPTLVLGYSAKGRGLARYVYGDERWWLGVAELTAEGLRERVDALVRERREVAASLAARLPTWEAQARRAGEALRAVLA